MWDEASTLLKIESDLARARAGLDEALVGLRAIEDPGVRVRDVERAVANALKHVYRALGCGGDLQTFRTESQSALEMAREALGALQDQASDDVATLEVMARVARAVGQLTEARYV